MHRYCTYRIQEIRSNARRIKADGVCLSVRCFMARY